MDIDMETLGADAAYRWMTMTVVPRPIAWVTSIDGEGRVNAAPFSFFTCLSANPPLVGITIMSRQGRSKDTLANACEMGDYVINIASEENLIALNKTSIEAPRDFTEPQYAGLHLIPSRKVRPPSRTPRYISNAATRLTWHSAMIMAKTIRPTCWSGGSWPWMWTTGSCATATSIRSA